MGGRTATNGITISSFFGSYRPQNIVDICEYVNMCNMCDICNICDMCDMCNYNKPKQNHYYFVYNMFGRSNVYHIWLTCVLYIIRFYSYDYVYH